MISTDIEALQESALLAVPAIAPVKPEPVGDAPPTFQAAVQRQYGAISQDVCRVAGPKAGMPDNVDMSKIRNSTNYATLVPVVEWGFLKKHEEQKVSVFQ